MLDTIKSAKPGELITIRKEHSESLDPLIFFSKLSNFGAKKHSILVELREKAIGCVNPCLIFTGKKDDFSITALNESGKRILALVRKKVEGKFSRDTLSGKIPPPRKNLSEDAKARSKSHLDVLRSCLGMFKQTQGNSAGLYGMISSEFVESNGSDLPDYIFYLVDNSFVCEQGSGYFEANALITEGKRDLIMAETQKKLKSYEKMPDKKMPKKSQKKNISVSYDLSDEEFLALTKEIKKQIIHGSVIQANPSRQMSVVADMDPLILYSHLRQGHEGYRFFMNTDHGIFMGTQPNMQLAVINEEMSFTSVSTSRPRGMIGSVLDMDLDSKREMRIWADKHEMIKHTMHLDFARNVAASVCTADSHHVSDMFMVQKEPQFQYLFSTVKGRIRQGRDPLSALFASLSFEAGMPRAAALGLLRKLEKSPRNFHGGAFVLASFGGELQSMLLEPIHIQKNSILARTSSYVLHDSSDDLQKSLGEEKTLLKLIKIAGGFK